MGSASELLFRQSQFPRILVSSSFRTDRGRHADIIQIDWGIAYDFHEHGDDCRKAMSEAYLLNKPIWRLSEKTHFEQAANGTVNAVGWRCSFMYGSVWTNEPQSSCVISSEQQYAPLDNLHFNNLCITAVRAYTFHREINPDGGNQKRADTKEGKLQAEAPERNILNATCYLPVCRKVNWASHPVSA